MTDYHTLITDDGFRVGDTLPNVADDHHPQLVVINPRAMPIAEALDGRTQSGLVAMIQGTNPKIRIAQVEPLGAVRPHSAVWGDDEVSIDNSVELEAAGGWRVVSFKRLPAILGPQGRLIIAAVKHGDPVLETEAGEATDAWRIYATESMLIQDSSEAGAWNAARNAALQALAIAGADAYWWGTAMSAVWGAEILALAARDLLDTTKAWTQEAYDLLTRAWRLAFADHPLHPQDAVLATAAA